MLRLLLDANDDPDILVFIVFSSSFFSLIHFSMGSGQILVVCVIRSGVGYRNCEMWNLDCRFE